MPTCTTGPGRGAGSTTDLADVDVAVLQCGRDDDQARLGCHQAMAGFPVMSWMRLPQVSSKTATTAVPMLVGGWAKVTPCWSVARIRLHSTSPTANWDQRAALALNAGRLDPDELPLEWSAIVW